MARPRKCRRVCHLPATQLFVPEGERDGRPAVILAVDEYETVRLIDGQGFSQEECAAYMQVARTTVQMIYNAARKKLAAALVEGLPLRIQGGDYRLCDGQAAHCQFSGCYKQDFAKLYGKRKGDDKMRIAVTYEAGQIFQHFGHTPAFKVYDTAGAQITEAQVVPTNGTGHGALAEILHAMNVDVLLCGGIGGGAQMALAAAGIKLYGGVSGDADAAVKAFVEGQLEYDPNAKCDHHDHHHGEGHTCGEHGCGTHHCGGHH